MTDRARIQPEVQEAVLLKCARRCALCFGLHGDQEVKAGQLAHIDRDPTKAGEDDLAFLCLAHHDAYDTKPSQSKAWQPGELRAYKANLEAAVSRDPRMQSPAESERQTQTMAHDRRMFVAADRQMSEMQLKSFLSTLGSDHSYTRGSVLPVDRFIEHCDQVGNSFLSRDIHDACELVAERLRGLLRFLAAEFFVYPRNQTGDGVRYCLKPSWNVDRDGDGSADSMQRYDQLAHELRVLVGAVSESYSEYRRSVKRILGT